MQRSMPRTIPLLVVILAVQLGLAALLAVRRNPLAATTPQTPLIGASVENADHILIEGMPAAGAGADSARVELARKNGEWILPKYFGAPADKFKLNSVLDELAGLKRGLPIATSSAALKRFKLLDGDFERRLVLDSGGKTLSTVYFGSSAGVRRTDARTSAQHAVYTVELATYELPTQNSDWLDANLLQRDPTSLTELDVTGAASQPALKLVRQPTAPAPATAATPTAAAAAAAPAPSGPGAPANWTDSALAAGQQIDSAHARTLAQTVAELHVDGILGLQDQPQWQQQHPVLTLGIRDSKHAGQLATWTISKPSSGDYYVLKASSQPYYFQLSSSNGKQLLDASAPAQLLVSTAQQAKQPAATAGRGKAAHAGKTVHAGRPAA
ncbi:MAG TPA: DUF4340 domain-containing protein [Steroidobacteraceae bacterium]|jgi:hypothetical protein|nr:DUF4340 domain-containing protein [Steroidobacteraceae bacterium]